MEFINLKQAARAVIKLMDSTDLQALKETRAPVYRTLERSPWNPDGHPLMILLDVQIGDLENVISRYKDCDMDAAFTMAMTLAYEGYEPPPPARRTNGLGEV